MGELIQYKRQTIHWRETVKMGGNPLPYKPRATMLLDEGTKIVRCFTQLGRGSRPGKEKTWYDVVYDRDYVTEWLLKNVLEGFPGITHVMMRELMTEALKLRKTRLESEVVSSDKTV